MPLLIDLTSKVFGRLTVVKRESIDRSGQATWLCKCVCGKLTSVVGNSLRRGATKSCGCLATENRKQGRDHLLTTRRDRAQAVILSNHKLCTKCSKTKKLSDFPKASTALDGYRSECKQCNNDKRYLYQYGIVVNDKFVMFIKQNGKCANPRCSYVFKDIGDANIDHNHTTGKIRALLCSSCNLALGITKESSDVLIGLAEYIKKYE